MTTSPGPHSDDGTFDLTDDALATLAGRHGARPGDGLTAITLIASLTGQDERCLPSSPRRPRQRPQLAPDRPGAGRQP